MTPAGTNLFDRLVGWSLANRLFVLAAALALLAAARAWAFIDGRNMVLPEDVQAVLPGIARHRLHRINSASHAQAEDIDELIRAVPLP